MPHENREVYAVSPEGTVLVIAVRLLRIRLVELAKRFAPMGAVVS
jgi:hypothetical protein